MLDSPLLVTPSPPDRRQLGTVGWNKFPGTMVHGPYKTDAIRKLADDVVGHADASVREGNSCIGRGDESITMKGGRDESDSDLHYITSSDDFDRKTIGPFKSIHRMTSESRSRTHMSYHIIYQRRSRPLFFAHGRPRRSVVSQFLLSHLVLDKTKRRNSMNCILTS